MTDQEKTISKIFDKSVEAFGIMTKSLCDAIKSTKTEKRYVMYENQKCELIDIDNILVYAESFQKEMHDFIDKLLKTESGKKYSYDELQTVFLFIKIAQLREEIEKLKWSERNERILR
jgi:hypothetical protein